MATAVRKEKGDFDVVLTLSKTEALVLDFICRCIGGDNQKTPRRHTDNIRMALGDVLKEEKRYKTETERCSIYFKE